MPKMNLGLEHIQTNEFDNQSSVHQMASDVLIDFYNEIDTNNTEVTTIDAICKLKQINDMLEYFDADQQAAILDYYSQDETFASIVGTDNRKEKLQQAIDKYESTTSQEILGIVYNAAHGAGLGFYIGKAIGNKTIGGCAKLCKKVKESDFTSFDTKLVNVPTCDDLIKHLDNMKAYTDALKAGITNPKEFTPAKAIKLIESLGFKNVTEKDVFSFAAGLRAALFGTVKTIGWGIVAGLGAWLVSVATFGIGTIPAMVVANVFHGYKAAKSYHDSYSKGLNTSGETLVNMGYNSQNLMSICDKYAAIVDTLNVAAAIKQTQPVEKQNEDSFKGTVNVFVASLKGTASVIANLIRAASK